jgi:hypothetical protein
MMATTDKSQRAFRAKTPLRSRLFGAPTDPQWGGAGMGCEEIVGLNVAGEQLDGLIFIIALFFGIHGHIVLAVFRCMASLAGVGIISLSFLVFYFLFFLTDFRRERRIKSGNQPVPKIKLRRLCGGDFQLCSRLNIF